MKKLFTLLTLVTLTFLTSCSSDDDNGNTSNIVGTWEYFQVGTVINGQELLTPYDHETPECGNDFIEFRANNTGIDSYFFLNDQSVCETDSITFSYTLNGLEITVNDDGDTVTAEILTLNDSTLKIQTVEEFEGETFIDVVVFKRI